MECERGDVCEGWSVRGVVCVRGGVCERCVIKCIRELRGSSNGQDHSACW